MSELNEPQKRAVLHAEGPLIIFAGAGSGKTRTITYRIANLLAEHGIPPYRILAVTFTNKAAGEMRARLRTLAGDEVTRDLWIGTFHSICARLLRRYAEQAGLGRDFVIYDETDQRAVLARILKESGLEDQYVPKQVLARIHAHKREGRAPGEVKLGMHFDDTLIELYEKYERALSNCNAVDFEDLILKVMRLCEDPESDAGEELRRRFLHVSVDEFQDTNLTQYRLIRALSARERNVCVVGDDDQSIYRWRGADVRLIRGFRRDFPDAAIIKLEQNYRSTANIVAAALGVIESARAREPKQLWTEAPDGQKVTVREVADERAEADYVVRMVQKEMARGSSAGEISVFYRVHAQSRVLEEAFRSRNIPYQIIGGMKFFERAEIKDVLAYLRLVVNPKSDADLLRVINVPTRGIGGKTVERLLDVAAERGLSAFDAILPTIHDGDIGGAAKRRLKAFVDLIGELRQRLDHLDARAFAEQVLEKTGYRAALTAENTAEAEGRLGNVEELLGSIDEYEAEAEASGEAPTLAGYLERVSLVASVDTMKDVPLVSLMTVHSAKGLEFEAVFLTGMEEDVFPYGGLSGREPEELDEERRLAYVAITRARRRLYITHAQVRTLFGRTELREESRFLCDLPEAVIVREGRRPALSSQKKPWAGGLFGSAHEASFKPGQRIVDRTAFDDEGGLRPGDRVLHKQFGEGIVERIEFGTAPIVVATFREGVKRIHARYLLPA